MAHIVEFLQFGEHLGICLCAGNFTLKFDDIAEFAIEWASTRELNANVKVMLEIEQVEARDRAIADVDLELLRLIPATALARVPGVDKLLNNPFRFAEHKEVGM